MRLQTRKTKMNTTTSITDVLSGNAPIKVTVTIDYMSAIILGVSVFLALGAALVIYKKI